jgi:hypothetical protein
MSPVHAPPTTTKHATEVPTMGRVATTTPVRPRLSRQLRRRHYAKILQRRSNHNQPWNPDKITGVVPQLKARILRRQQQSADKAAGAYNTVTNTEARDHNRGGPQKSGLTYDNKPSAS